TALDQGLQGHWRLDEESGTRYDNSSHSNNLTDHNTVGSTMGQVGLAGDFERSNSERLSIDHSVQNGLNITGSLTLVGWIKPEIVDQYMIMAAKYEWGVDNRAYRFDVRPTGQMALIISPNGQTSSDYSLVANAGLVPGTWYHVAGVFDAQMQTLSIYLDGELASSRSVNYDHINSSTAPFMLGANMQNGSVTQYFDGVLDEWRVYDRVLSQAEIHSLMSPNPPSADFAAIPSSGIAPLTVVFTNNTIGDVTNYVWNYGDGITSTASTATHTHTYASAGPATAGGAYTVSLTATGPGGSDTRTRTGCITVYEGVVAEFEGSPISDMDSLTVNFVNQSTGNYDTCIWGFGDGNTSPDCNDPSHLYDSPGIYTVILTVSGPGGSDTRTRTNYITVYEGVVAGFEGSPTSGVGSLTVNFDNQSTGDYDTCIWDFGDGNTSPDCNDPSHLYDSPGPATAGGAYTVILTVSGPGGSDTRTRTNYITVYEGVVAEFEGSPTSGVGSLTVNFVNQSTGDYDTCVWDFGDGATSPDCNDPSHLYDSPGPATAGGAYTVSLTISGLGGSDTRTRTDYITVTPPVADFGISSSSSQEPQMVVFNSLTASGTTGYLWDLGDGTTSAEENPVHAYTAPGVYTVVFTATGVTGTDVRARAITIHQNSIYVDDDGDCSGNIPCFDTIQAAVGDVLIEVNYDAVLVAQGTYTSIGANVVMIGTGRDIDLLGGWNDDFTVRDPDTYVSTIDGQGYRRCLNIDAASPLVDGFHIVNGSNRFGAGIFIKNGSPIIQNNVIHDNSASNDLEGLGSGGGIYVAGGSPTIQNNVISGNTTDNGGGGIQVAGGSSTIQNNVISNNTAHDGGGIAVWSDTVNYADWGDAIIQNNVIYGNTANRFGGGISISDAGPIIQNNVIVANRSERGGGIYQDELGESTLDYNNVWKNDPDDYYGGEMRSGSHDISTDPLFVDAERDDFHLTSESPCIDKGDPNTTLDIDFDGESRPQGEGYDIGADEYTLLLQPLEADFTATPRSGAAPLTVNFFNLTTGEVMLHRWNFGDRQVSSLARMHTYTQIGVYTVTLTAYGRDGSDTLTRTNYITVTGPPPIASFTAAPSSGAVPLIVDFTNLTTGDYKTCTWDFGDGDTSDNCNDPRHRYNSSGVYTASLTVSGVSGSDILTRTNYITVTERVVAEFEGSPTSGMDSLTVSFDNQSTGDYETCAWDFGNGNTSHDCNDFNYTYNSPGIYTVILTVSGLGGSDTRTRTDYITVHGPPTADFDGNPTSGVAPLSVTFVNHSTVGLTYLWDFGDGQTSTIINPTHTYTQTGVYTVTLTVTGLGDSDTLTRTHYIAVSQGVTADFSANPTSGVAPLTVNFANLSSGSYDTCTWNFGDGNTIYDDCNDQSHTYISPGPVTAGGAYTVSLTVSGLGGTDVFTRFAYVEVLGADFTAAPRIGAVPRVVTFTDVLSDRVTSRTWNFGDGSPEVITTQVTITHYYTQAGVYTPTLTIMRDGGYQYTEVKPAFIIARGAEFSASPQTGLAPLEVTFTDIVSGPVTDRIWDFGDGEIATDAPVSMTHTYVQPGIYTPTLTVIRDGYTYSQSVPNMIVASQEACAISTTKTTWWDSGFFYRQPLTLTVASPLVYTSDVTQVLALTLDTQTPITDDLMLPDGNDLRVVYLDAGNWRELPRHLGDVGTTNTTVYFPLQATITVTDTGYYLYYGRPSAGHPTADNPPELYPDIASWSTVTTTGSGTFTPTVAFTASTYAGLAPLDVSFSNLTTPTTGIDNYTWNFGDGTPEVHDFAPNHPYANPGPAAADGAYTVTLTAVTDEGLTVIHTWVAAIQVPGLDATADATVSLGERESPTGVAVICAEATVPQSFSSADGRLTITFPPGAVTETIVVTHTPKVWAHFGPKVLTFYDMTATTLDDGRPVTTFDADVVFDFQYGNSVEPEQLEFTIAGFSWNEAIKEWERLPANLDTTGNAVTFQSGHFSDFAVTAVGMNSAPASAVSAAQSDLFSGAATWSYPLHVPPGRNGLQPGLALSYNSHLAETRQTDFQRSGLFGLGFNLEPGFIDIDLTSDVQQYNYDPNGCLVDAWVDFEAYLTLNGARTRLIRQDDWFPDSGNPDLVGDFRLQQDNFLRVQLFRGGNDQRTDFFLIHDDEIKPLPQLYWVVTTKEGTIYRFGDAPNTVQILRTLIISYDASGWGSPGWMSYPKRTYLNEIEDVYGNTVTYGYTRITRRTDDGVAYNPAILLSHINYNADGTRRVVFEYNHDRLDEPSPQAFFPGAAYSYYRDLLSAVSMRVNPGGEFLRYEFGYDHIDFNPMPWGEEQVPVLQTITAKDESGQEFEAQTTFGYYVNESLWRYKGMLRQIENGYGGSTSFSYSLNKRVKKISMLADDAEPIVRKFDIIDVPGERRVSVWNEGGNSETQYAFHTEYDWNPFDTKLPPLTGQLKHITIRDLSTYRIEQTICYEYDPELPTSTNENVFVAPTKKTTVFEEGICYLPAWSEGGIVVEYDYDNEYGNLLETFEHGDPNTSTDDHRIVTTYIDNGWDRRIPTLPRTQTIYGRNGVGWEVAAQTNYDYVFQGSNTEALARVTTTQHGLAGSVDSTSMVHYNSHGNVDWTQDGLGNRTVVAAFDSANVFPSIVTYPPVDGLTLQTQTTYDPRWGTPKQVTGFNSDDITEYRYDPFGRLQEVEDLVAVTRYDYAKDEQNGGLEVATTYAYDTLDAYQTSVKYNALGQMIQSETEGGSGNIIVDYEYDGTGRQVWTSVPYIGASPSLGTRTEYDALGRPRAITNHDTTTQRFDYDGWQRTTFTNQEGHQTVYGKDAFGRTTWVRQYRDDTGAEPQTRYGYDTLGNLTDVWDAAASSNHTEMTYDGLGRTLTISDTDTGYWTYVYDANGNLITQTDARDQIITFEYDALNRLIAKCGSEICENLNLIAAYTYDDTTDGNTGLGRRTGMEDASGRTAWIYDAAGRLAKETKVISYIRWAIPYTTSFTYDFLNRLDTLTYPDDEIVTYGYDAGGQVNHLASGIDIYLQDAQYTALGQPDSLTLGAGVIVDFGYYASNNTGKPAFALESIYVNGLLNLNDYRYHLDGNLEHVSGSIGGSISPTNLDLTYSYNSLNWLDTVNGTVRGEVYDRAYAYDDIGNLTTKNDLALNYDTEAYPQDSNQPAHAPGRVQIQIQGGEPEMIDFGYDDNGNRITRLSSSGDLTMYDYDEENRLVELSDTTFVYDGDGNRIKEVDNDQDSTTYVNGYYEVAPWSDNVVIYNETGRELNPNMVSDDDGKLYLVWVECSSDDAGEVRFATRDPDTGDWSSFESIGHISDLIDDGCRNVRPVVSVDSDRNVTVAWNEYGNSSYNILARHQLAGGGWSAENLVANSSNDETFPSLVSAPDGTVFLAWQSCDGSDCTVHVARSMSGSWTNEYQTGGGGDQSLPALASDNEGTIYLVYADIESSPEDGFYLVRRQANAWVSSPEPVGINGDSFDAPLVLAIDSQGNLFVMQANDLVVDNNDIPYSITMEDPDDQWHPITVENTQIVDDDVLGADNPTIAVGPKGMLVAVWEGNKDGESTGLFMSYKSFVKHYFANGQRIATRTPDDSLYYLLSDHLGSTSVIVDSAGGEVGHIVYDPFGEVLTNTLTLTVTDRLFTGQRWDGTIGLYDYNARFYDPQIGQFTQPDSLVVGATNPIAWNRYAYVHNNPVNHTDSTGHVIDTLWDAYDLAADAGRCVFGSDALSCYMVPLDVAALAVPGVPGVADNAARHIDDVPLGRTAYLIGGLPQDMQGVEQIVELSSKYDEVIVNDIIPSSDLLTEFTLEKAGYQLSNVKYVVGDAAKLSPLHHTDIFAVAPNAGFHYGLVEVGEKVLGNESRLIVASNLSTAESLANTLRAGSASVFEGFYEAGDIITQVGSRKIRLTSRYLYTPGRHIPSEGWRNTLIIVTR
ncbi:MAG: PKD domain-containing protein, partial [Chloroflexi bacterium]|nr:PKD domain-containing protein [Chloroflexota bacterium]